LQVPLEGTEGKGVARPRSTRSRGRIIDGGIAVLLGGFLFALASRSPRPASVPQRVAAVSRDQQLPSKPSPGRALARRASAERSVAEHLDARGGSVAVRDPSSPIRGVTVHVPSGALDEPEEITVSHEEVLPFPVPATWWR
jgi:hypothetical protein